MLNLRLSEIAVWTRGELRGADIVAQGVSIDTRSLVPGQLFVALPGARTDGHAHLGAAARAGAAGALVSRWSDVAIAQVKVADVELALGDLASAVRGSRRAQVVGITGSNGKTTVKMLSAAILALHGQTHVSAGNQNNEIGVPLSLLAMPADARYAVIEMGAGKPGDIAYLAAMARPDIGLITNIAPAHLERMGSIDAIAETKGALLSALPADGVAIVNADDAFADYFATMAGARRVLRFGISADADLRAQAVQPGAQGTRFALHTPRGSVDVALPLAGRHNVANALAAAAVGEALEVPLELIAAALGTAHAVPSRLFEHASAGGWIVIDDSYNANPASLAAALATLALRDDERWLVLGDMAELGADAQALHADAGRVARDAGVDRLFAVGPLSVHAVAAFGAGGEHFGDQPALVAALRAQLRPGVVCLVKGSRSAAMERVVAAIDGPANGVHADAI